MLRHAQGLFRRWFAKVWQVRGGGLYACGFALTFVYLEIRTVLVEFIDADSIGSFFSDQLFEFVFHFVIRSFENTLQAFIWPIRVIQTVPPYGAIGLVIAYFVFAKFLKQRISDWLFPDGQVKTETE